MNLMKYVFVLLLACTTTFARAGTHHYYYTDPQGTVLAKADAGGAIIATYDYAPYGTAVASMSPAPNGPGYTGHVNDPDSGLVYMQARYYDPAMGRFLSVDPEALVAGNPFNFNRFDYGNNNPITNVDPTGKFPLPPLFQLNWFHSVLSRAVDENLVQPAQLAYNKIDEKVNVTTSVGGAMGVGVIGEVNVLHRDEMSVSPVYGEGGNISIDVAPKHGLTFNIFGGSSEPSNLKLTASAEGGDIFHLGISTSLDKNGNVTIMPKVGLGYGELATTKVYNVPVVIAPQIDIPKKADDPIEGGE